MKQEFMRYTRVGMVRVTRCSCLETRSDSRSVNRSYRIYWTYIPLMQNESTINPATLALWEIVSVLLSCLIAEWVVLAFIGPNKLALAIPVALALTLMIFSHRIYGETLKDLGFRTDNFLASAKLLSLPTIIAIALIIVVSGFSAVDRPFRWRFLLVPLWALFQQYALQGYINRRAQVVAGQGWKSVLLVALLFAAVHLPNPLLFALTFV